MAEVVIVVNGEHTDFAVCNCPTSKVFTRRTKCGKVLTGGQWTDHLWAEHREAGTEVHYVANGVLVEVLPHVRNWPFDHIRRMGPWTPGGLRALDEMEQSGIFTAADIEAFVEKQKRVLAHITSRAMSGPGRG